MKDFFKKLLDGVKKGITELFSPNLSDEPEEVDADISSDLDEIKREAEADEVHIDLPPGLTSEEVDIQIDLGNVNVSKDRAGKSYLKIIADNVCTFFNLVWAIITVVLVSFGAFTNLTYLLIVIPNIAIATIQQLRAKRTVEKLSVTTDPKATVVRDGELWDIDGSEIVIGEVMRLELGRQVLADCIVISGGCEANESMITGESVPIKKTTGDRLLAGSFLVSGSVFAKVDRVGKDNYVHSLEKEAKNFKAPSSNLFRDLNKLIKFIGIFIIPMTLLMALANLGFYRVDGLAGWELWRSVVLKTCGSTIGMIPSGIYLLVTLTLSVSQMTLAKKHALVQDMYSIEMLASADVLCLDKTGTITDGTMEVSLVIPVDDRISEDRIGEIMAFLEGEENATNATSRALISKFGKREGNIIESIPFSSARKYTAMNIEKVGCFALGAPHFTPCDISPELDKMIDERALLGERVLVLAELPGIKKRGRAIALICIADRIRPSAVKTIESFQSQGVTVKVISGDHAATVSSIARKVGIKDADKYISCEELTNDELAAICDEYSIFGRVTPEQKVLIIKTLKAKGHTVAMTGDGVNDTLALKEANCAISVADGSEVAKKVSQIVLMNSDFSSLPSIVLEGRRCINNVRQSAMLYLMKTIFTIFLSIFSIVTVSGYPFEPNNFLFLEFFIIGVGSFALAFEPNDKRIEGSFLDRVLVKSFPCAVAMFIPTLVILLIGLFAPGNITVECRNAVAMCVVTLVGFTNLIYACRPFTLWRFAVVGLVGVSMSAGIAVSAVMEATLSQFNIFGFTHVMDNVPFFVFMLALGIILSVLLNFFRSRLEEWFDKAIIHKRLSKSQRKRDNENV